MDRRQQKTRNAIFGALSKLLTEKSYNNITVQEIVEKANIGRSTFYAHFETKDDLLRELCTDLFQHVFSNSRYAENTHDFSKEDKDPYLSITHILYHLMDNSNNIISIITCENNDMFLKYFKKYFNDTYTAGILSGVDVKSLNMPQDFIEDYVAGTFMNMILWWIKGGIAKSPIELTEYYRALIDPVLKRLS